MTVNMNQFCMVLNMFRVKVIKLMFIIYADNKWSKRSLLFGQIISIEP